MDAEAGSLQGGPPPDGPPRPASGAPGSRELIWGAATGGPWPDPAFQDGDERWMALALRAALAGVGLASPNPPVGCVLVKQGRLLGSGGHLRAGGPHGEILALADARERGEDVSGATAYVTLEPCCHHGRTPPCAAELAKAGVKRVVVGVRDPNPRVDGGGIAHLRARGVEVVEGVLGRACGAFHAPFFKLIRTGLPWVAFAPAPPAAGAAPREASVRSIGFAVRRCAEAVVIGRRTAEVRDPRLRDGWPDPTQPHRILRRVVLDARGSLDPFRRVWAHLENQPVLRATLEGAHPLDGVEDLLPEPGPFGLSLDSLLRHLAARGAGRVLFEGGDQLARRLLALDLVDEFHRFRADRPAGPAFQDPLLGWPGRVRLRVAIPGGSWEILERRALREREPRISWGRL